MHYSSSLIESLARAHGIEGEVTRLPSGGIINEAWLVGEAHVLRIAFREDCEEEAEREALVVPLAVRAGIRTPKLAVCDSTKTLAPMPYTIYERAKGVLLGYEDADYAKFEPAFEDIGREIARLGRVEAPDEVREKIGPGREANVRRALMKVGEAGAVSQVEVEDISGFLDELEPTIGEPPNRALVHQDWHPWNIFVAEDGSRLTSIIDWGDAAFGDPAMEFASMPLAMHAGMMRGYIEEGGVPDPGFERRAIWYGICFGLWELIQLSEADFDRRWWRMPPGGWAEMKGQIWAILS